MSGIRLADPMEPGSREWYKTMSASKIAAVVGLSPYESRFSLWHRMAGLVEPEQQNARMARGHYLEDGIARWFSDEHPDFDVTPGSSWRHAGHAWATASPDRDVCRPNGPASLEVKADDSPEWDPAQQLIPSGYYAQVQWQMLCSGHDTTYVAHLGAWLRLSEFVVTADSDYQAWLLREAQAFMATLPDGSNPQRPNLDGHTETLVVVRQMHPEIGDGDLDIPESVADEYLTACAAYKAAESDKRHFTAVILDLLNEADAKRAVVGSSVIASKRTKGDSPAYLQAAPAKKESHAA